MTAISSPPPRRARLLFPTLSRWAISTALLLSAGAASATPSVIRVPADYTTIQDAIDNANSGDTIVIADGTYTGTGNVDLDTNGTNLTIQSQNALNGVVIDCGGSSSADHRGFNIHSGETVSISGLTIKNGYESNDNGGGVYVVYSPVTLTDCVFSSSTAVYGGGVMVFGNQSHPVTIARCAFLGNSTPNSGGGVYTDSGDGSTTLTNCAFSGNSASYGGGAYLENTSGNGSAALTNSTLTGNTATSGGGVYSSSTGGTTLTNDILYGNTTDQMEGTGPCAVVNCDITGALPAGMTSTSGLSADPLFVSATDFHLQPGSPCLAAGTASGAPTADFDGTMRPAVPSIGAYDIAPPVTLLSVTTAQAASSIIAGATDQFTATAHFSDATTADVTASATWTSGSSATATVDAHGLAAGIAPGTVFVTATYNGTASSPAGLVVLPAFAAFAGSPSYDALWDNADGSYSVWSIAAGGGFAPHGFDAVPGFTARSLAMTPNGHAHVLLSAADGTMHLSDADMAGLTATHNSAPEAAYGPYAGWTALQVAAGSDGVVRVLWTRTDGQMSLWKVRSDGSFDHSDYGPYPGWSARFLSVAPDSTVRVVWTHTSGQVAFWIMDAQGGFQHAEYGPYAGWSPSALATGPDGLSHIAWNHAGDGAVSVWQVTDSGAFVYANVGPYPDWSAGSLTVGADNTLHFGWSQPDGTTALWNVAGTLSPAGSLLYGPYTDWHLQGLAAAP